MRGNNCTLVPAELASAVSGGIVTSTEQVYDYLLQKRQENINQEIIEILEKLNFPEQANHWFTGTEIDGEGTVTFQVLGAKLGDLYLNIATYNIYKANSSDSWVYQCNIKGSSESISSIEVNGENYTIDNNGKITLPDYPDEVIWGNIKGTLSDQTDLQEILTQTVGNTATINTCMEIIDELL